MKKLSTVKLLSGNKMPQLGLGTWQMDDTAETVTHALETGYRLIDTSSDYNTQPGIGEAIKNSKVDKADIFVTTKVEETDDAYKRVLSNLEELGVNQVDLILIHRPPKSGAGEQLWKGLIKAKNEGLVKDIGVSNYSIEQMEKLFETSGEIPVVNQVEWSPFGYSSEMKKYCDKNKIVIQAYSPLTRKKRLDEEMCAEIAENYNKTPAQILLRWSIQMGAIPIPKANTKRHLEEDLDIFDFEISNDDMQILNSLNEEYSTFGELSYV
jgi:diketogulonate reductase-like aldo/keto reductase